MSKWTMEANQTAGPNASVQARECDVRCLFAFARIPLQINIGVSSVSHSDVKWRSRKIIRPPVPRFQRGGARRTGFFVRRASGIVLLLVSRRTPPAVENTETRNPPSNQQTKPKPNQTQPTKPRFLSRLGNPKSRKAHLLTTQTVQKTWTPVRSGVLAERGFSRTAPRPAGAFGWLRPGERRNENPATLKPWETVIAHWTSKMSMSRQQNGSSDNSPNCSRRGIYRGNRRS